MIRELHVYGRVQAVGDKKSTNTQHRGIGKTLLRKAEWIARFHCRTKMAIISGIGVRDYYRKRGYYQQGTFMVKNLFWQPQKYYLIFVFLGIFIASVFKNYL